MFALFSLVPIIGRYLAAGDFIHGAMGWTSVIFLMALLVIGKRIHETLTKSLYLRFENNQLIDNLTRVNDALEVRVRERTHALQEADRRKNEFIAMLAHELRNPLAPMSAAITLMGQASTAAVRNDAVVIMRRQMQQMARLVDDLLDIGQIQNGVISLRDDTVEVSHFLKMSIEMAKPTINASGQKMTVVLSSEPLFVKGDEARLAQVISNLLNNASKFTAPGGSIEIVAQRQHTHVAISVKDSGIGIPAQDIESIFDLFVQVDGSPERTKGGLGIGLALVKKIVGMHGGTVAAASEGTGHGSEFIVTLPLAVDASEALPPPPAELQHKKPAGRRKILVVDDNVDAVNSLAILLRIKGHEVREAYDGPHALAIASEFDPEIVVCDIGMPGMNGLEVAQRLRSLYPQGLMLIALTGYGSAEDRARSRKAGFDAHFVKPANFDDLQSAIAGAGGSPSPP
jgi:signal transduction histidine kinase/ActR/RegA family two-component response regulator